MRQWQMRLERAEYEVALAERRYQEVDPSNRLVAGTLERRWNDALVHL
jgi:FAD/FMN-containing dehydrogenase